MALRVNDAASPSACRARGRSPRDRGRLRRAPGNGTRRLRADPRRSPFPSRARNFPFRQERGSLDLELPDGAGDEEFWARSSCTSRTLSRTSGRPRIYLAGADPWRETGSAAGMTKEGRRARPLLAGALRSGDSHAVAMAGGYGRDTETRSPSLATSRSRGDAESGAALLLRISFRKKPRYPRNAAGPREQSQAIQHCARMRVNSSREGGECPRWADASSGPRDAALVAGGFATTWGCGRTWADYRTCRTASASSNRERRVSEKRLEVADRWSARGSRPGARPPPLSGLGAESARASAAVPRCARKPGETSCSFGASVGRPELRFSTSKPPRFS